jgi:predicted lactoylglutathione lyase
MLAKRGTNELLKAYGGTSWQKVQDLVKRAEDLAGKPPNPTAASYGQAQAAYQAAAKGLPLAVTEARKRKTDVTFQDFQKAKEEYQGLVAKPGTNELLRAYGGASWVEVTNLANQAEALAGTSPQDAAAKYREAAKALPLALAEAREDQRQAMVAAQEYRNAKSGYENLAAKPGTNELLKAYGGASWQKVQDLVKRAEDLAGKPPNPTAANYGQAQAAYQEALKALPLAVTEAQKRKTGVTVQDFQKAKEEYQGLAAKPATKELLKAYGGAKWTEATSLVNQAEALTGTRPQDAAAKYKEAATVLALALDEAREARERAVAAAQEYRNAKTEYEGMLAKPGTNELVKAYGGASWQGVQDLVKRAEDLAERPPNPTVASYGQALGAYQEAVKALPLAVTEARQRKTEAAVQDLRNAKEEYQGLVSRPGTKELLMAYRGARRVEVTSLADQAEALAGTSPEDAAAKYREAAKALPLALDEARQATNHQEREKALHAELDAFKMWFNLHPIDKEILNPPGYTLAGQRARELGALGQRREWYLQQAVKLEKEFKTYSLTPSPPTVFDDLKKRIRNWE